ncbi:MAG: hypothetical protein M4579_002268 [Chaenotheca gracillima]|nr:MAG: hypothetical protein M4579_002268 [Chaenotheca gracillima]
MSSSAGTKVTSDPERYQNPTKEGPGAITSDSLAADSSRSGGAFSENRNAEPQGVSSHSTTSNNTNTSGATTLPPAPDAETRQNAVDENTAGNAKGSAGLKYAEGAGGQGNFAGQHSAEYGYSGGPTSAKQTQQPGGSGSSNIAPGPTYVGADVTGQPRDAKPKGKNLTEGGFSSDDPNASFNNEIGTKNDPGRLAEGVFQRSVAESGPDAGGGPRQKGVDGNQPFDVLGSDNQA